MDSRKNKVKTFVSVQRLAIRKGLKYGLVNMLKLAGWKIAFLIFVFDVLWFLLIGPFFRLLTREYFQKKEFKKKLREIKSIKERVKQGETLLNTLKANISKQKEKE